MGISGDERRKAQWRRRVMVLLVAGGLVASVLLGVLFPVSSPRLSTPSLALGSELVLTVQRVIFLFAAWLLIVVVLIRASQGLLPAEVSARGVRYADTVETQFGLAETAALIRRLNREIDLLDRRLANVEKDRTCKRRDEE
jgi:hypothetical protein